MTYSPTTQAALERLQTQPPTSDQFRALPANVIQSLIKAECALANISEGAPMDGEGNLLRWAEKRAACTLARIRPVMHQYGVRTSEWPPLPSRRDRP